MYHSKLQRKRERRTTLSRIYVVDLGSRRNPVRVGFTYMNGYIVTLNLHNTSAMRWTSGQHIDSLKWHLRFTWRLIHLGAILVCKIRTCFKTTRYGGSRVCGACNQDAVDCNEGGDGLATVEKSHACTTS